jgi:hypothetical protein
MTNFARVVTISEIIEYTDARTALELIRAFMDNELSARDIETRLTEEVKT